MEKKIVNNYGSFDVTFVKSKSSTMWDSNGKKYIDFIAGELLAITGFERVSFGNYNSFYL